MVDIRKSPWVGAIVLLFVTSIGLSLFAYRQASQLAQQKAALVAAGKQIRSGSLAEQERCSKQAERWFEQQNYSVNDLARYTNHYNQRLTKCVVAVESELMAGAVTLEFSSVWDAYENKQLGSYVRRFQSIGGEASGKVTRCSISASTGKVQQCSSLEEFERLAEAYMSG